MRVLSLLMVLGLCPHVLAADPPNILLIVAEDMSLRVGAFGDNVASTPAIDALAGEGVRYTNTFTASGVCAPSRSALITGVYPPSMGTHQMRTANMGYEAVPPPEVKAFPELLRRAGYVTANSMKKDYQFGEPFTVWDADVGDYSTPADLAVWRHLPRDRPFFAMITLMDTHESRLVDSTTKGEGQWAGFVSGLRAFRAAHIAQVTDPSKVVVPPYYPDTPEVRANIAQHYDNIHYIDSQVAEILGNLKADGLEDDTVVIWTTDHGDGLPRAKRSVYDSGIHVPMIVRHPEIEGGVTESRMVSFVDIAPTILALAGVSAPDWMQGFSFLGDRERDVVFAARDRMDQVPDRVRAARNTQFKYIRNYMPELAYFRPLVFRDMFPVMRALWQGHAAGTLTPLQAGYFTAPRQREELYDLSADPFETRNIAGEDSAQAALAELRAALDAWLEDVGDLASEPEGVMIEHMWPGGKQPVTAAPVAVSDAGRVSLSCATPGASIGYRWAEDAATGWSLYSTPVPVRRGSVLHTKAIRYGYAESAVTQLISD